MGVSSRHAAGPVAPRRAASLATLGPARHPLIFRAAFILLLILSTWSNATAAPKRILVIQSFGLDFAPYSAFSAQLRTQLARQWPHPAELRYAFLETALFGDSEAEGRYLEYLETLYGRRPPDLVVPIGGPAVQFVQKHRRRLFQATPMLMAGVEQRRLNRAALTRLDTVVAIQIDLPRVVTTILTVLPQTTRLYVVLGASPLERYWELELRRELLPFADRLEVTYWSDLSFDEMRRRASRLPTGSAIIYGLLLVDADGIPHEQTQTLAALHTVANAPIFGVFDSDLGHGIVGGPLIPVATLSRKAAEIAARVLAGEAPSGIHTPPTESAAPLFDWHELKRWSIDEARLPTGSEVRYRDPSLWQRYRWRIIGVSALVVAQALLIVGLLVNQVRRRLAERRLNESEAQLALAAAEVGIWSWEPATDRVWGNERWHRIFGLTPERPSSYREVLDRVHAADRAELHEALQQALAEGTEYLGELRAIRPDGAEHWLSVRGRPDLGGGAAGIRMRGAVIDITERKRAEEATRRLSANLIEAQEQERARLARELHDDMTQRLARLAIDAARVEVSATNPGARDILGGLHQGLVDLSEDVRILAHQLHCSVLDDLGLGEALRVECDRLARQHGVHIDLSLGEVPAAIPSATALCLFRVAQEALRNALRHSGARELKVSIAVADEGLRLVVRDDGAGFDPESQGGGSTLGLASMRERVSLLGGDFDVESAAGLGTIVMAWVPLSGGASS